MKTWLDPRNWKYRRRYLAVVTGFTMAVMVYAIERAEPSVAQTVITMGFGALMGFTGTYVFGAVWDHLNQRKQADKDDGVV